MAAGRNISAQCCIVGGGPAGMMLGVQLARAGVSVIVLEKHGDFLRDFRGDTVHPSTIEILEELGLLAAFERLPQRRVQQLKAKVGERLQRIVDFRGLKPFDYLSLVPQWEFLDMLADEGNKYSTFDLRMRWDACGLIEENGRVRGVHVATPEGEVEIRADVVVGCDGRNSRVRDRAGFRSREFGAPMDVLWFRLPRTQADPEDTFGILGRGHMMVLLNRTDYWQTAVVVPKGGDTEMRAQPIQTLRDIVATLAPFLEDDVSKLSTWDDVKTLEVRVDRLERWCKPGLLMIGDAAHAMSPVGGVGINLAIQDSVAAANVLAPALLEGKAIDERLLRRVQERRVMPTRIIQGLQLQIQKRLITRVLNPSGPPPNVPALLRWLLRFQFVRRIPARIIGYGIRREHVRT